MSKSVYAAIIAASVAAAPALAAEQETPSIAKLDRLVGAWSFVDQSTALAGFDYHEEGVMRCERALDDQYIACHSEGMSSGKTRHYVNYFTYNDISGDYEMTGLFGNFPEKAQFVMTLSDGGSMMEMRGAPMQNRDGNYSMNWGRIKFEGADKFTWEVRLNRSDEAPDHWPLKFVSTYKRIVE